MLLNCPHTSALIAAMPDLQFTTLLSLFSESNVERMALYIYKVLEKAAAINYSLPPTLSHRLYTTEHVHVASLIAQDRARN